MILNDIYLQMTLIFEQTLVEQECIPVGCVPPTAVAATGVWARTRSHSTSPLGMGLDQIPLNFPLGCGLDQIHLNFPLGCGPGPDPPSTSPLGVGLNQTPQKLSKNKLKISKKISFSLSLNTLKIYSLNRYTDAQRDI